MIIYTTGCAKSGTTLMQNLISTGFHGATHIWRKDNESLPPETVTRGTILSAKCRLATVKKRLEKAQKETRFVIMMRHPYSLLLSRAVAGENHGYHNTPHTVMLSFKHLRELMNLDDPRVIIVRFEDLIQKSMAVQYDIAEKFTLLLRRRFRACFEDFAWDEPEALALKEARHMDFSRVWPWRYKDLTSDEIHHLTTAFKQEPELLPMVNAFGYQFDEDIINIDAVRQHARRQGKAQPPAPAKKAERKRAMHEG